MELSVNKVDEQFSLFPGTRYMGSKNKIVSKIGGILLPYQRDSFFDAFAGSNVIAYYMKTAGKRVETNDFMAISYIVSKAIIENSTERLSPKEVSFITDTPNGNTFISEKFYDLYFDREENAFLDRARANIECLKNPYKKAIALAALVRACMKKRPRGIFTFIGHRYDDGRADIRKTLREHFIESVTLFNDAVFDNGQTCTARNEKTEDTKTDCGMVYLDPPYFTPNSDNDYVRRYHFVEGLVRNWVSLEIQEHTLTKKFKSFPSPFSNRLQAHKAFENLIDNFRQSVIAISYSSNSLPTRDELVAMLKRHKKKVVVHEIDHLYSFGNQNHKIGNPSNRVKEYLFVGS